MNFCCRFGGYGFAAIRGFCFGKSFFLDIFFEKSSLTVHFCIRCNSHFVIGIIHCFFIDDLICINLHTSTLFDLKDFKNVTNICDINTCVVVLFRFLPYFFIMAKMLTCLNRHV